MQKSTVDFPGDIRRLRFHSLPPVDSVGTIGYGTSKSWLELRSGIRALRVTESGGHQKKGGDNQIGYHLPGWGGVLLGKLNTSKPIIAS
jgi:hypothetical protein